MPLDFSPLDKAPRLLLNVPLQPIQGSRFQPTGFPDLGAATFTGFDADGEAAECLLVESAQSMANRLEKVCWDEAKECLVSELQRLPYVRSTLPDKTRTDSIREAHRLNSPYIVQSDGFKAIAAEIGFQKNKPFDRRKLAHALFKYDPCSLIHGIFLVKLGGVVRLPRFLSSFIEATNVESAASGGSKHDRVQPTTGDKPLYGGTDDGYGNVIFHREEFTANRITAYFSLDLAQLRGYGFDAAATKLLIAISLFKIQRFLHSDLRLRSACDLAPINSMVVKPKEFVLPSLEIFTAELPPLIEAAAHLFTEPRITDVNYRPSTSTDNDTSSEKDSTAEDADDADSGDEEGDE